MATPNTTYEILKAAYTANGLSVIEPNSEFEVLNAVYSDSDQALRVSIDNLPSSAPGGNDTEVQFNSNGSFSGSPYLRYLSASKSLNVGSTYISGTTNLGINMENLNGSLKVGGDDTNLFGGILSSTYAGNTFQPLLLFMRSLGTTNSPTAVQDDKKLGIILFGGYDGTNWKIANASSIKVESVRDWTTAENATKMVFSIVPSGKTSNEDVLILNDNGNGIFNYGVTFGDLMDGQTPTVGTIRYASNKLQGYEPAGWFNLNPTQLWVSGSGFSSILVNNSNNSASGDYSIAGGNLSSAKGYASIAIGQSLITSGQSSFGIGGLLNFTSTNGNYGGVLGGKNCTSDAEGAVIIGCSYVTASTQYTTYTQNHQNIGAIFRKSNLQTSIDVYTIDVKDYIVLLDTSGSTSGITVTIPTAQIEVDDRIIIIKDATGAANSKPIAIQGEGSQLIDGATSATISDNYNSLTLLFKNGAVYII